MIKAIDERMRFALVLTILFVLMTALFIVSLLTGPVAIGFAEGLRALIGHTPWTEIMWEIRLPRAVGAVLVGASLGLAGAALQGFMRNPLAEPGLVGVTGGASVGAVLAIHCGLAASFQLALPLCALLGAGLAVASILFLAGRGREPVTLVLAGVAISTLCAAVTTLVLNLSPNPYAVMEIVFWLLGSLADLSMPYIILILPFVLVGWVMLFAVGRMLNIMTLGPEAAASMGVSFSRLKLCLVIGAAACVGATTAVAGTIGFVGLVVPHIMRPLVCALPSRLLPASALGGAIMVLLGDIAVRRLLPWVDLKLGVLTALIGAPFFLWLVISKRGGW